MKTLSFLVLTTFVLGAVTSRAQDGEEKANAKKVMVAFLGVSSRKTLVRDQIKAKCAVGTGLVAQYVVPGSPAADGGLQKGDIMEYLDNQLLINPEQLRVLIQSKKPNTTTTLVVRRDGKKVSIPITLGEREQPRGRGRWNGNMRDIQEMLKGLKIQGKGLGNIHNLFENMDPRDVDMKDDGNGNFHFRTKKDGPVQLDIRGMKDENGAVNKTHVFRFGGKGHPGMHNWGDMFNGRGNNDDEL